jgi:hypothetical protein
MLPKMPLIVSFFNQRICCTPPLSLAHNWHCSWCWKKLGKQHLKQSRSIWLTIWAPSGQLIPNNPLPWGAMIIRLVFVGFLVMLSNVKMVGTLVCVKLSHVQLVLFHIVCILCIPSLGLEIPILWSGTHFGSHSQYFTPNLFLPAGL